MFSDIANAPEVLMEYTPKAPDRATINGVEQVRYRTTRTLEYRGLTEAAAVSAADDLESDIAGAIKVDGSATSPTLHVDGFMAAAGYVWPGTGVKILGDDNVYRVKTLATIATNEADLVLTENYLEPGTIKVKGGSQTGTTLIIDGFTNGFGYVRKGTTLTINAVTGTYTVTTQASIIGSEATITISPALDSSPADDAAVTLAHPADNTAVELTLGGIEGVAVRADGPMFNLRIKVDYYDGPFRVE
jgi:hypothetical protein